MYMYNIYIKCLVTTHKIRCKSTLQSNGKTKPNFTLCLHMLVTYVYSFCETQQYFFLSLTFFGISVNRGKLTIFKDY